MNEDRGMGFMGKMDTGQRELMKAQIQASLFNAFGSRHTTARTLRKWHQCESPEARARKKIRRKISIASRKYNYKRAKGK